MVSLINPKENEKTTYKYAIKVEYIGKNYAGSQLQPRGIVTIQSELEKALSTLIPESHLKNKGDSDIKKKRIKTVFSGRTDKGVNSKGQIVHIELNNSLVASKFIYSMNEILPNDISISADFGLKEVSTSFHAQKSAKKRTYQYVFLNRPNKSAFDGDLLLVRNELNIQRMQKSLEYLLGEHDFSSFESSGASTPNKTCFIYKVECNKLNDTVVIDIVGNRFLYNMVRAIVGTLLMIEKNNLSPEAMKEILEAKDRSKAGKTVSPYGLTLMNVQY